jgi:hypothetical protein
MTAGAILRGVISIVILATLLGGCTHVTPLQNARGQKAHCGGEMWTPWTAARDERCLTFFQHQGFTPVK